MKIINILFAFLVGIPVAVRLYKRANNQVLSTNQDLFFFIYGTTVLCIYYFFFYKKKKQVGD